MMPRDFQIHGVSLAVSWDSVLSSLSCVRSFSEQHLRRLACTEAELSLPQGSSSPAAPSNGDHGFSPTSRAVGPSETRGVLLALRCGFQPISLALTLKQKQNQKNCYEVRAWPSNIPFLPFLPSTAFLPRSQL